LAARPACATFGGAWGRAITDDSAPPAGLSVAGVRIGIGLFQGVALYGLYASRVRLDPVAFGALWSAALLAPIAALGAVGAVRRGSLAAWIAAAALVPAAMGAYDRFVAADGHDGWPSPPTIAAAAAVLYILHHLIVPADRARRWRADYEQYFDEGWRDAVRLVLAALFVGALWLLLLLGAQLFRLIGLRFLEQLIRQPWFAFPLSTTAFAIATQLTDVSVNLVRGARALALTLLSWLGPVLTLITAGFLLALPFTGLKALWATRSATGLMLSASAALIILINANYQDGERPGFPPRALKWSTRIAAVILAPLVVIAAYGLMLRIGQYGLTPSRIYALACVLVAACYAVGYLWAAISRGTWMKPLETANWWSAQIAVGVVLLVFSPVFDPARLSVQSQVGRLRAGAFRRRRSTMPSSTSGPAAGAARPSTSWRGRRATPPGCLSPNRRGRSSNAAPDGPPRRSPQTTGRRPSSWWASPCRPASSPSRGATRKIRPATVPSARRPASP